MEQLQKIQSESKKLKNKVFSLNGIKDDNTAILFFIQKQKDHFVLKYLHRHRYCASKLRILLTLGRLKFHRNFLNKIVETLLKLWI